MPSRLFTIGLTACSAVLLAACGDEAQLRNNADFGPNPVLTKPSQSWLPTIEIAPAKGWPSGRKPNAASGLEVTEFGTALDHPRWLLVLPNNDVLVAESNAPEGRDNRSGIKGWFMQLVMTRAGAGVPSADRISLLRDGDGDGVAETKTVFASGLKSPFGMALVGNRLYVANTDALVRFDYVEGQTAVSGPPVKVADLPAGPINHHWTKNVIASPDGAKLYVTVGSNSNVAERGMAHEERRAAILEIDAATGNSRVYASGLRNPNGMAFEPTTGALWTVVNERDELGSDLVPDYMTTVKDGGFYGWPYSYFGHNVDTRVEPQRPDLVAKAIKPDYALGAHTASLGLAIAAGLTGADALPPQFANGAFIGQHGSWNRRPRAGYEVIFVPFENGRPAGMPRDVLTGFVTADGDALGRPVGVALDRKGALLVADDVGNKVWRVRGAPGAPSADRKPTESSDASQ